MKKELTYHGECAISQASDIVYMFLEPPSAPNLGLMRLRTTSAVLPSSLIRDLHTSLIQNSLLTVTILSQALRMRCCVCTTLVQFIKGRERNGLIIVVRIHETVESALRTTATECMLSSVVREAARSRLAIAGR